MKLTPYTASSKALWDQTVGKARNATFLFFRDYMDYHSDRFRDCSLLFLDEKGRCVACLPANFDQERQRVETHGGLTYGGLLCTPAVTTVMAGDMMKSALRYFKNLGASQLIYKPVPHIYHVYPCEEELYWLFRLGAVMTARAVSTTIRLKDACPFSALRQRKVRKAQREQVAFSACDAADCSNELFAFWELLTDVLQRRHHVRPVHTFEEMDRLQQSFPENIRLLVAKSRTGALLCGCLVFLTANVAHVQYIAASEDGFRCGALDYLFSEWIARGNPRQEYVDFGISTEDGGRCLNEGLIFQKEGFGGRATCYDTYTLKL